MSIRRVVLLCALLGGGCSSSDEAPRAMRTPPVETLERGLDAQSDQAELAEARLAAAALAPFPYTSGQIRDAMPLGFTTRYRIEQAGRPAVEQVTRVVARDDERVTLAIHFEEPGGVALADPLTTEEEWAGLRDHAAFPQVDTDRRRAEVEVAAGRFDCWRYEVTTRAVGMAMVSVFDFADDKPGSPIRYERIEDGERTFLMELIWYGVEELP